MVRRHDRAHSPDTEQLIDAVFAEENLAFADADDLLKAFLHSRAPIQS
jgi:hypothetical protein